MEDIYNKLLEFLPTATSDMLDKTILTLNEEKEKRTPPKPNLKDYVEYVPEFTSDNVLIQAVLDECEELTKNSTSDSTPNTHWLCHKDEPYIYPDKNPIHKAKDIKEFPNIINLMSLVNASEKTTGTLDSCLVLKYPSPSTSLRVHSDDEQLIDQHASI